MLFWLDAFIVVEGMVDVFSDEALDSSSLAAGLNGIHETVMRQRRAAFQRRHRATCASASTAESTTTRLVSGCGVTFGVERRLVSRSWWQVEVWLPR